MKEKLLKLNITREQFSEKLKLFKFSFKHQGKVQNAALLDYIEGEVRVKDEGAVFWRLQTVWYQIHVDYLRVVHMEIRKILKSSLISTDKLPHRWPSPESKEKCKKILAGKRYDVEAEYNQSYIDIEGFFLVDKICPQGIELFDLLHVNGEDNCWYLFHVNEGFGQHTRDACSQIINAAKLLRSKKFKSATDVISEFYDMATAGGDVYRTSVIKRTEKVPKDEFMVISTKSSSLSMPL